MRISAVLVLFFLTAYCFANDCAPSLRTDAGLLDLERAVRNGNAPEYVQYWNALRSKGQGPGHRFYSALKGTATGRPQTPEAQEARETFRKTMLIHPALIGDPFPVIVAEAAKRKGIPLETIANIHPRAFEFIPILRKGQSIKFKMGSPEEEVDRVRDQRDWIDDERQHPVTLNQPFAYGATVVPVGIYRLFLDLPQHDDGEEPPDEEPIRHVTWHSGQALVSEINKIAEELGLPGRYRLPKEAETELVMRMDENFNPTETAFAFGNAWDDRYGHGEVFGYRWPLIDTKVPLPTGVADLMRMIRQWQEDGYGLNYGLTENQLKTGVENPIAPDISGFHVLRGGCAAANPYRHCRAATRDRRGSNHDSDDQSLRLVREDYDE